jgi:pimeloyl-ACP methyl ester carboxylesterase
MTMALHGKPTHPLHTLVFVHGYLDGPEIWERLIGQLTLPEWHIVTCRLTTASPQPATSAETLERYMRQVLDQGGIANLASGAAGQGRWVIVGHSMGAQVAELVASELDPRLSGLVRITPAPLAGCPLPPEVMARFETRAALTDPSAIGDGKHGMAEALDDAAVEILVRATLATGRATALEQLYAWTGGHPAGHQPSAITAPVLTVATDDRFFTADLLEQDSSRFQHRTFEQIPGAGHWPQLEQTAALARVLERFVSTLP